MKKTWGFLTAILLVAGVALAAWPTGSIDTQHLDQDTDSPLLGRPAIKQMADQVNTIRDNGAPQLQSNMATAATPGTGVLRDGNGRAKAAAGVASDDVVNRGQLDAKANLTQDGQVFAGQQNFVRDNQSSYDTAAIRSLSNSGDVGIGLHAGYVTAAFVKHVRGGSGIEVRDATNSLARIKAAPGVASDDVLTKGQVLHGRVGLTGTAIRLPPGWSVTKTSTGNYRITHTLNSTLITVVPSPAHWGGVSAATTAKPILQSAATFDVFTSNKDGVATDSDITFMVFQD